MALRVTYPDRLYYHVSQPLLVEVRNLTGASAALSVSVGLDYVRGFRDVRFMPDATLISGEAAVVRLDEVGPGETRLVEIEVEAERIGRHAGTITVTGGAAPVAVEASSFALP